MHQDLKLYFDKKYNINKYYVCPEMGEPHLSEHYAELKELGF